MNVKSAVFCCINVDCGTVWVCKNIACYISRLEVIKGENIAF